MKEEIRLGIKRGLLKRIARVGVLALLGAATLVPGALSLRGQAPASSAKPAAKEQPFVVEYYYKTSWGHADEWLALFKKNHLPVLKALKEQGRIVDIEMEKPRYHMTEEARWDFRVAISWKSLGAANDSSGEQALIQKLYPDQETYKREEQRRFEILLAHWDLPIIDVE